MKKIIPFTLILLGTIHLLVLNSDAQEKIKVVATTPDLADMTTRIGGDLVEVSALATGVEDPHAVPMKPSFAMRLNRAKIVVLQGLGLEHAFLPGLLDASRNNEIQPGTLGYIDCSAHIAPLEVPVKLDRALGEQHPLGNPHFNLDPVNGEKIAQAIEEGLERNFPQHGDVFKKNLALLLSEIDSSIARMKSDAEILKGVRFVSYHPDFVYLAERYGMVASGTIELKAGVDATPSHIEDLISSMQRDKVEIVIREKHYPAALAATVAERGGATLVELPIMSGGLPETKDYVSFTEYLVKELASAIRKHRESK